MNNNKRPLIGFIVVVTVVAVWGVATGMAPKIQHYFTATLADMASTISPTPTFTPYGGYRGVMISVGNPGTIPADTVVQIPLNIGVGDMYPQTTNPYHVTAIDTKVVVFEGLGTITGYTNSTPFPDVVQKTIGPDGSLHIVLGVGTGNPGVTMGNTPFGSVSVRAPKQAGQFCIAIDRLATDVAAEGVDGDVFDLNNTGGWVSQACLTVSDASRPGDTNTDGKVDIFDYNAVVSDFGKSGPVLSGDLDHNGIVDIFDYNTVVSNFGK